MTNNITRDQLPPVLNSVQEMPRRRSKFAKFENVKGYATYDSAVKRGEEVAKLHSDCDYRWVVIGLPSGRFAPMIILNNNIPGGPGQFIGERNVCLCN